MKTIIIASNNAHKAKEIKDILSLPSCEFLTLKEAGIDIDPEENESTYIGNARIKALATMGALKEKAYVLADDSGLEVDALDGAPGVHSARYAKIESSDNQDVQNAQDEENNKKLLRELADVDDANRSARFVCQLVLLCPEVDKNLYSSTNLSAPQPIDINAEIIAKGTMEGEIAHAIKGSGGFGYDPLFLPDEYGDTRSAGELTPEEKNDISHRSCALRNLREKLLRQGW